MRFKEPPSCLDSAYEREAVKKGLVDKPVFKENRMCDCYSYQETREAQIPEGFKKQPDPKRNDHEPVWKQVISDMWQRHQKGIETYGVPLQPFNGRDALWDAYEEALDLAVYLRQAIEERNAGKA